MTREEFMKKLGSIRRQLRVDEQEEVKKMGELVTMQLNLESPRMQVAMAQLGLTSHHISLPLSIPWAGPADSEHIYTHLKQQLIDKSEARKAVIRRRNRIKQ